MISKKEQTLYDAIKKVFPEAIQQLCLEESGKKYYYDISYKNYIIEFNGDYWHGNPEIYEYDDYVGIVQDKLVQAWELWEKDARKTFLAESNGYKILTIWESEYNDCPNTIYRRCIDFLNGK